MSKISITFESPHVANLIHKLSATSTEVPVTDKAFFAALLKCGFSSLRFYDIAQATAGDSKILVLSASAGERNSDAWIGTKIRFEDTTIGQQDDHSRPAVGTAFNPDQINSSQKHWIEKFALQGYSWVDLPLVSDNELIGLIALDWKGDISEIDQSARLLLELLSSRIARGFEVYVTKIVSRLREKVQALSLIHRLDEREFAISVSDVIMTEFSNSVLSIFEYDWTSNSLRKIVDRINPRLGKLSDEFPEIYPVGASLTGAAWESEEHQHIFDFDTLVKTNRTQINEPAATRYAAHVGSLTSFYYQQIGFAGRRFLLRLINRCDDKRLPITATQVRILRRLESDISLKSDAIAADRRLQGIQNVTSSLIHNIKSSRGAFGLFESFINTESVTDFVILCHRQDDLSFCFEYFSDRHLAQQIVLTGRAWGEETFYTKRFRNDGIVVSEIKESDLQLTELSSIISKYFFGKNQKRILVVPINAGGAVRGFLGVVGTSIERQQISQPLMTTLQALATIVGTAIEADKAALTHARAQNVVAYIGHEIRSPVVSIRQMATEAIETAREYLGPGHSKAEAEFSRIEDEVNLINRELSHSLKLAEVISHQRSGRMEFNFRQHDLSELIFDVVETLRPEFRQIEQGRLRTYEFTHNAGVRTLGKVICDGTYIKQALTNLIRNAMKYSYPSEPGRSMNIEMEGWKAGPLCILRLSNWGLGIPAAEREDIFRQFVRGSVLDDFRRRSGMGLGLYISRLIVQAHKGHLFCFDSKPTLADPNLVRRHRGYRTTFELRLPADNKVGVISLPTPE